MAKGTLSPIIAGISGATGSHTSPIARTKACTISFAAEDGAVVLRSHRRTHPAPSATQSARRLSYSECDCLWKRRERNQADAWKIYIDSNGRRQSTGLDYYRLFMSDCLNWNLVAYLETHLMAIWQLIESSKDESTWHILVKCASTLDFDEPAIERDPFSFGSRFL